MLVGMPLALAEAHSAFDTLLRHFPNAKAAFETPEYGSSFILRGLKSLHMTSG